MSLAFVHFAHEEDGLLIHPHAVFVGPKEFLDVLFCRQQIKNNIHQDTLNVIGLLRENNLEFLLSKSVLHVIKSLPSGYLTVQTDLRSV